MSVEARVLEWVDLTVDLSVSYRKLALWDALCRDVKGESILNGCRNSAREQTRKIVE